MLINYQGELRSRLTGEPVADGNYDMLFRIYDVESGGAPPWTGTHSAANGNPTEVAKGQFSVILGSGPGNVMDVSVFNGAERWLEIRVGTETLSPRQRITSVVYSLVSENSLLLGGKEASDFVIQAQGLRLETNDTSPNVIGGHGDNAVTAGAVGATIAGGGLTGNTNTVTDSYGTIGGGEGNQAGDNAGTTDDAYYATVGGGSSNRASGRYAAVSGGWFNDAANVYATVGGGYRNNASANSATISGGYNSSASANCATVGGGYGNNASSDSATIGGGRSNTASGGYATVGGGYGNQATADYATIAGGGRSSPSDAGTANRVTDDYGTVGGGGNNQAGDNAGTTTDARYATVGGGYSNTASDDYATVGGGQNNTSASRATVGGGEYNTASGFGAAVGGGALNTASGAFATVSGGYHNTAQDDQSFAAGTRARANHTGSFVWGDSRNADIASTKKDEVTFRCLGGVRFLSGAAGANQMVSWAPGNASWAFSSDRNLKENFVEIDPEEVLERVCRLPVTEWNFKGYSERHVGPMAQDFHALFQLSGRETMIDSGDLQGVALAAIQGLHKTVQEKEARISRLEQRNNELEDRLIALESLVGKLTDRQEQKKDGE